MRGSIDQLAQRLSAILDPAAVLVDDHRLAHSRLHGISPSLLVSPESLEQLVAVVRLCSEAKAAMIPCGGGTALAIGNPPRHADVLIRLDKLARIIEHDAANLTVSAECGVTLAALQTALGTEKQFAPVDPPFPDRATLGGTIAANLNGPRRACYGGVRDLVIGVKAVLPGGELIKAGGKVVKNVAGYDMSKLFAGSLGTLGIIAEATLRVAPIAERATTLLAEGSLAETESYARAIAQTALLPAAVWVANKASSTVWQAAVWCEGFSATVERQVRDLKNLAEQSRLRAHILDGSAHLALWSELRDFPLAPDRLTCRATVPRAAAFGFLEKSREWTPQALVYDAQTGSLWLSFAVEPTALRYFQSIESAARERRGHAVLLAAPPPLKKGVNVWGDSPATLSIMREIKRHFDPDDLLNPGRFVGGI